MVEPLNAAEISEALAVLDGWAQDGDKITKTFEFASYPAGLAFASAAGYVADNFDHHPDLFVGYKKVTVAFTTHDAGSKITQKDIDVATAIEKMMNP